MAWRNVTATSSAVVGRPSCHTTSRRSRKVSASESGPAGTVSHDSASHGTGASAESSMTSGM
jgi:hypothetical protein